MLVYQRVCVWVVCESMVCEELLQIPIFAGDLRLDSRSHDKPQWLPIKSTWIPIKSPFLLVASITSLLNPNDFLLVPVNPYQIPLNHHFCWLQCQRAIWVDPSHRTWTRRNVMKTENTGAQSAATAKTKWVGGRMGEKINIYSIYIYMHMQYIHIYIKSYLCIITYICNYIYI